MKFLARLLTFFIPVSRWRKACRHKIMTLFAADIAKVKMPVIKTEVLPNTHRHDVINTLQGSENIGIELGVATGIFSERMVCSGKFKLFFGVDAYTDTARTHDTNQYAEALKRVGWSQPYRLLRMNFTDALNLFDDNFFDFIYIDGYAHTGEDGGQTLYDWYDKLKVGGVFAGDDYHPNWPLTMWAVNEFANNIGADKIHITELTETSVYSGYPSWMMHKTADHLPAEKPSRLLSTYATLNKYTNK